MTTEIENAAFAKLNEWKAAFNAGNGEDCAACYEQDALMVATPFGEFQGRDAIATFWNNLAEQGFSDINYSDVKVEVLDDTSMILSASWTMNKAQGVITKELWVMQEDGTALMREDRFEAQGCPLNLVTPSLRGVFFDTQQFSILQTARVQWIWCLRQLCQPGASTWI